MCGYEGHFAVCCKSKAPKNRSSEKHRSDGANHVTEKPEEESVTLSLLRVATTRMELLICVLEVCMWKMFLVILE